MKNDVDFLNSTLNLIKTTENTVASLPLRRDDIRACFFLKVVGCLNSFYFNYLAIITMNLISIVKRLELPPGVPSDYHQHIQNLINCLSKDTWRSGYRTDTNRHLIIDVWTAFEICIDVFLRHMVSENELITSSPPVKTLKGNIHKRVHSTIKTKIDAIYTVAQYPPTRQINNDKEFLLFFAKTRNSMHNNFMYHGNDYEYVFRGVKVIFKNGKFLWFSASEDEIPFYFLDLIEELALIFHAIVSSVNCAHFIMDPMLDSNLQE